MNCIVNCFYICRVFYHIANTYKIYETNINIISIIYYKLYTHATNGEFNHYNQHIRGRKCRILRLNT